MFMALQVSKLFHIHCSRLIIFFCVSIPSNHSGRCGHIAFPKAVQMPPGGSVKSEGTFSHWLLSAQSRLSLCWLGASGMRSRSLFT